MKKEFSLKRSWMWLIVLIYTFFIFNNSMMPGETSGNLSATIARFLYPITRIISKDISFESWHHFIRKSAHFCEFALLGILIIISYRMQPLPIARKYIILLFLLIPVIDEGIQMFVDGRAGRIADMTIDACGYLTGILIDQLIHREK